MAYIKLFLDNKRIISFGFLLTLFSSAGQTFLLSLYVPFIIKEFQLTNSSFGMLYGAATVLSAMALAYTGKFIDYYNLRNYTLIAAGLLMLSCIATALSYNVAIFFIGLWGLRFAGQGLLSHISGTSMARFFSDTRGKALSFAVLGYALGEGLLPVVISAFILFAGWRNSMLASAALIGCLLLPFIWFALNKTHLQYFPKNNDNNQKNARFKLSALLKSKGFAVVALNVAILPCVLTGLFVYQLALASEKGWSIEWLATCFIGYAVGRAVFGVISGKLIDRFSAIMLFPVFLIPFAIALFAITFFSHPLIVPTYLVLTGIAIGMGNTVNTAFLAEAQSSNPNPKNQTQKTQKIYFTCQINNGIIYGVRSLIPAHRLFYMLGIERK